MSLVIIGSGLAGYMLAKEWRKRDAETPLTIFTSDDGAFYSKPLLSTALAQKKTPEQLVVSDAQAMSVELNARILTHTTVTEVDPVRNLVAYGDQSLAFSRLVFACGGVVVHPQLSGDAVAEMQAINSLTDYRRFRVSLADKKKVLILGAGLVGCEFANDLMNGGYEVTVVAPEHYPLAEVLPATIAKMLENAFAEKGVHWLWSRFAVEVNRAKSGYEVTLSNGEKISADVILSAVGLRASTPLAKQAGIAVNRGIRVNRRLQTNFPHIFALGDCAEVEGQVLMYVAPLLQCARALANILAGGMEPVHYPIMPIVLKTPAFPLVFVPPPQGIIGEWHFEGEGHHIRGLFYDPEGQLRGFALAGDAVRDKMPLAKQLPVVFSE